jgi:hypothetical protein
MKVKNDFQMGTLPCPGWERNKIWKGIWLDSMSLSEQCTILYYIAGWKEVRVIEVFYMGSLNLTFCRTLIRDKLTTWKNDC